jgi:predicted DNA-binding protein YlxM (UPF0122 family)
MSFEKKKRYLIRGSSSSGKTTAIDLLMHQLIHFLLTFGFSSIRIVFPRENPMSEHYNTDYSKEEVADVLQEIQECIRADRFTIALNENREENLSFVRDYNLRHIRRKQILLQIETEDFCHSLQNTNVGYEHEVLYVFCPQVILFNFAGEEKQVDVYIKFNIIEVASRNRVVVISFHERNKPIDYLFR